eukprot:gene14503-17603_t
MNNTALTDKHISLGAKMVPFAGYNMPVQYEGINAEHQTVRNGVGVFDVSHMGEFILKGDKALDLIQRVTSNDASKLYDGKVQYSCLPNENGGIVDDLLVYRIDEKTYMLVVNASNIEKDWNWIQKFNTEGVEMHNISDKTSLLAIQGPKAAEALQSLTDIDLASMEYYNFKKGVFAGVDNVVVSATGYTGAGGFEIYFDNEHAYKIWDAIFEAGKDLGIKPIGLGARDTLRLEMGFCLYGNDIDDTTSPIEAGLGWITKFSKTFTNSAALQAQKEAGIQKKLIGFEMIDRGIPRHDYEITDEQGQVIGRVTSGTQSPSLQKAIGMGYVNLDKAKEGSEIYILIRNAQIKAKMQRKIEVCLTPALLDLYAIEESIVVVIDILRATSSIVYGIDNGAEAIIPVAQVEDCLSYKDHGYLLAAERNGEVVEGYDFGNSPFSYTSEKVAGKTVVLTTTNGTKALHLDQDKNVLLLCAGWKDQFNLEDTLFAGAVVNRLRASFVHFDDSSVASEDLYVLARQDLRAYLSKSSHSHRLAALNIEQDPFLF